MKAFQTSEFPLFVPNRNLLKILAFAVLFVAVSLPASAAGNGVWTKPATVKVVFPRIFPLGGNSFPTFEFKTVGNPLNDDGTAQSATCHIRGGEENPGALGWKPVLCE